jgi:hypothetical protein
VALLHRWAGLLISLTLVSVPLGRAVAQSEPERLAVACFEVTLTQTKPSLTDAILLNRCSGETWLLVRTHKTDHLPQTISGFAYRWRPIAIDRVEKAIELPPRPIPAIPQSTAKCFVFDGRQFCE